MYRYEVEVKARVRDERALRERLKEIAIFKKRERREDKYFALEHRSYPHKSFRIRFNGKKYVVNFKKRVRELESDNIMVKKEYEFDFHKKKDLDNFLDLVRDFGFYEWIEKVKHTETFLWKEDNKVVIELNKVEKIGVFIEIEFLTNFDKIQEGKRKILRVLKELEIGKKDVDNVGYTKRLYWKRIKNYNL